ncbi:hypothetical protein ABPG75_009313 [Micractinium tetrahymenae]
MVPDGAIKSLSPEARRIFREAQDNIIELNKSRLRALDELKAARQKIAELEGKLEAAVAEASSATAQLQQLGPASSQRAAQAAAAGQPFSYAAPPARQAQQPAQQYQPPAQQYQHQQAAPPAQQPAQQPAPESGASITIVYETGWNNAHLHYNADGRGWTSSPGVRMENGNQQFPDKKVLTVPGRRLEFVINDGGNDWDKPNPYGGSKLSNYVVEEPGVYRLRNGKVTRLA